MGDPVVDFFAKESVDHQSRLTQPETHYPGSKARIERPVPSQSVTAVIEDWDAKPLLRNVNGKQLELFSVNHLAKALGRKADAVRKMIKFGYLPQSPFRSRGYANESGKDIPGRRLYTREMVEVAVARFAKYRLLDNQRLRWERYPLLPKEIQEEWTRLYSEIYESDTIEDPTN